MMRSHRRECRDPTIELDRFDECEIGQVRSTRKRIVEQKDVAGLRIEQLDRLAGEHRHVRKRHLKQCGQGAR